MSIIGSVINGWEVVSDGPYQGFDDAPHLGYHGRFWCRSVMARKGSDVVTVRGPDSERMKPEWWGDRPYPTVQSQLAER